MTAIYFALIFLIGILLQLLSGNLGIYLPVVVILVFYAAAAAGLVRGIACALAAGIIIDVFSGWGFPWNTFVYLATVLFARFWCARQMLRPAFINFFPGMVAAALQLLIILPPKAAGGNWRFLLDTWLPLLAFGLISGAILLPLAVALLDRISDRLKLPRYQDSGKYPESRDGRWRR